MSNRVLIGPRDRIKSFDTALDFTLTAQVGTDLLDLTGGSVMFILKTDDGEPFVAEATIDDDPASGVAVYTPGEDFPTTVGVYQQEWEVTTADGLKMTFPQSTYNKVTIVADLNGE